VSHFGLLNSLSQTVLKLTLPGVPDTYQGTELWDFSLVDPDNRRPVDFPRRRELLRDLKADTERAGPDLAGMARRLLEAKDDGRIKLYVTWRLVQCLRANPGLFSAGSYTPLRVDGTYANNVFAFFRQTENRCAVVAVSRFLTAVTPDERRLPLGDAWADTRLVLPDSAVDTGWRNPLTGEDPAAVDRKQVPLSLLFRSLPVAVLTCGQT
jgi:(1->4)-alpha-D-glucan 1-alpha-D-glucosylmutase